MIIAVTATRNQLTKAQVRRFLDLVLPFKPQRFLHGGCKGGDYLTGLLVHQLLPATRVIAYPADDVPGWMAPYGSFSHEVMKERPALIRNRMMVDACDLLVALPQDFTEKTRSGTWATIRYAREVSRTRSIILPDGKIRTGRC